MEKIKILTRNETTSQAAQWIFEDVEGSTEKILVAPRDFFQEMILVGGSIANSLVPQLNTCYAPSRNP